MTSLAPYDAVLVVSYGGPRGPEDVLPFLRNATRGRGIPDERLAVVGEHYALFGGVSPINDRNEELMDALRSELAARGVEVPIVIGNRNWTPYLADTLGELKAAGAKRVLCVLTSAYASYSSCRQYREDLARAVEAVGGGVEVDKIGPYFDAPGFVEANAEALVRSLVERSGGAAESKPGAADASGFDSASLRSTGRGGLRSTDEEADATSKRIPRTPFGVRTGMGTASAGEVSEANGDVTSAPAEPAPESRRSRSGQVDRPSRAGTASGEGAEVDATSGAEAGFDSASLRSTSGGGLRSTRVLFVTHSIPTSMDSTSGTAADGVRETYRAQHLRVAEAVIARAAETLGFTPDWELVYCSRSGAPHIPWLEPDINDRLPELAAEGVRSVVVAPIGFVNDHMEVVYDLDTQARDTAVGLGLSFRRAATAGTHPAFVASLVDELVERAAVARGDAEPRVGVRYVCPSDCCLGRPGVSPAPAACSVTE